MRWIVERSAVPLSAARDGYRSICFFASYSKEMMVETCALCCSQIKQDERYVTVLSQLADREVNIYLHHIQAAVNEDCLGRSS